MNIICFDLPNCNFNNLLSLHQAGHTIHTVTYGDTSYIQSLGINVVESLGNVYKLTTLDLPRITQTCQDLDIDIMIVTAPFLGFLHTEFSHLITYIGPTPEASELEVSKTYAKEFVAQSGVRVPEILEISSSTEFDSTLWPKPLIVKPTTTWSPAVIVNSGQDQLLTEHFDRSNPYELFVEEYIHDKIETNVFYTIAQGTYTITHTQRICGEDRNKNVMPREWYFDTYIEALTPEADHIVRLNADLLLTEVAKLGGCYEGSLCGFLTSDNIWYFGELNARPDVHNSLPTLMSGDDWLRAMTSDIELTKSYWRDKQLIKAMPTLSDVNLIPTERYPIELHDKYRVYAPSSLTSDYLTQSGGCVVVSEHRSAMDAFVSELEQTTNFRVNRPY
jgi:hypothetical protein